MTATDELRRLLDERGVEYKANDIMGLSETCWGSTYAFQLSPDSALMMRVTPEQAVAATLGTAYEPPIDAHWDGDVLVLTTQRDPSSIHVQRAEGHPRKVYPAEATMGPGTCEGDANALLRDTRAENAKLRELVRISIEYCNSGTCDECPIQGEDGSCPYVDMARELGIEVES